MEGKSHQSRPRSISKNPKKGKPREENRFSFEKKRHQSQRQERGSIMRKQKKFEGGKHHQLNKDDMQLTIENIMLLSGIDCIVRMHDYSITWVGELSNIQYIIQLPKHPDNQAPARVGLKS